VLYTNQFNLILNYYKKRNFEVVEHKVGQKTICFEVIGFICFRDMKYYYGSDKFSCAAALNLIENSPVEHWNSSYTGTIGKMLKIDEIKKEFPPIAKDLR
jgi:hypothetical protein